MKRNMFRVTVQYVDRVEEFFIEAADRGDALMRAAYALDAAGHNRHSVKSLWVSDSERLAS